MRRADRLFQLVQLIRGRRLTTAAFLAQRLEVSERTVYRDVADLQHQGVPIEGEAGVGYRLGAGFELPPLMFTQDEASALVAAARLAQSWVDPALARDPHMRAFRTQLERVVSTPKLPEWELITTRLQERVELAVRGRVAPDSALALLDRDVEHILEKRRWMRARALHAAAAAHANAGADGAGARR